MRRAYAFGNAVIDEVFRVDRLPQAGESVLGAARHKGLGGKGANQAIALARTGVETRFVAAVGRDDQARQIRQILAPEPVIADLIDRPNLATDRSLILAQRDGENVIVTTNDCAASLRLEDCHRALGTARPSDLVLLQGNLSFEVTAEIARLSADLGLSLALNPSPFDPRIQGLLPHVSMLFVNEAEARGLTGQAPADAVRTLRAAGVRQVVLTMGGKGALLGSGPDVHHVPAAPTDVIDATGAGDVFEGTALGSAILRETDLDPTALAHGAKAAALTIAQLGAVEAFPSMDALRALLSEHVAP